jgi:hypothetical protein
LLELDSEAMSPITQFLVLLIAHDNIMILLLF